LKVDPDVDRLIREERLIEAARLASERGDARGASALFERACDWASAAVEALHAGEARRSLDLAVQAGDDSLAERAAAVLATDPEAAEAAAAHMVTRGRDAWAARLLERAGLSLEAARAWERAGAATRAAELLERSGEPARAAQVLEAELRRRPETHGASVALGALLARFGKDEAAVRALQRVPEHAPERRDALAHLVGALGRLGLSRAARDAGAELEALGGAPVQQERGAPAPRGALLFGRYEPVRDVSSSPSARVIECVDVVRGERVAVKLFAAGNLLGTGRDALARFAREMQALRALHHPSVVPLREFFADVPAIVLSWMDGGTLESKLSSGPIAPAHGVEIAGSVLHALGDAHRLGILHRDVKPANILFDSAGAARLSDFGAAHLGDASATATAGIFGTRGYMSPEQRQGRSATARSDIFSVGVVLREMLTGERPNLGNAPRLCPSEAHGGLDRRHDALIAQLTAEDAASRPADALETVALLLALPWPTKVDMGGARAGPESRLGGAPKTARLEAGAGGKTVDAWTGREIERVPLSAHALARARHFAIADHPALQMVLRVDRDGGEIWLAAARGRPLDRPLSQSERTYLDEAVAALHAAGDASTPVLVVDEHGGIVLCF
jgi:tetratricopeptide (TPR) repeat protein